MTLPAIAAVREFKDLLQGLYVEAGRPAFAAVAEHARSVAARFGAERGPTRAAVGAMLRADSGLPSEDYAVLVGAALARAAGRDPAAVGEQVRAAWRTAHIASRTLRGRRPGVPVGDADPFAFGIHRVEGWQALPAYVRRPHDDAVARVVDAARAGASRVMALVGTPCSGRSRTAWEAVRTLPSLWRIWRPDESTPGGDVVTGLVAAGPYTVVWLTDAAPLLDAEAGPSGPPLVAAVRALIEDPGRAPVLVMLALWPQHWTRLTAPPLPGDPDRHAATRSLLRELGIVVPDTFTAAQAAAVNAGADPVLHRAAAEAGDGRITQALAGVPGMLHRYERAPAAARAVLDAAVDARRFGFPPWLRAAFLLAAAADEPAAALDYATAAAGGAALLVVDEPAGPPAGRRYRLAEAVYHAAAAQRAAVFPPARFWNALAAVTDPGTLLAAGAHAERRGRLARAVEAYRLAAEHGHADAMVRLAMLRERAGDHRGAGRLAIRAAGLGAGSALELLAVRADESGGTGRAEALARAAAAAGDPALLFTLARRHPGTPRAEALYRAAAEHAHAPAAAELAVIAHGRGDVTGAERYARQAAAGGDTTALRRLAELYRFAGPPDRAERFAVAAASYGHAIEHRALREEQRRLGKPGAVASFRRRAADDVDEGELRRLDACLALRVTRALAMAARLACRRHTGPLRALAVDRYRRGEAAGALRLAVIAGRCGDPSVLAEIAVLTAGSGDEQAAVRLAERAALLGDSSALRRLARNHRRGGDADQAVLLLERAAAGGDPDALFDLARTRHRAGDVDDAETLYRNAARGGVADAADALARLLQDTDPPAAAAFARRAVELGHPTALRDLGRAREHAGDLPAAIALYRQAGDRGDDTSARLLARLWDRHRHADAARLATEAAEHGNPAVLRHLADLRDGAGRHDEAAVLYWSAYAQGDPEVLMRLPHMRAEDDGDQARAERLALQAAAKGHHRAVADLGAVRALTGDLAGAERLHLRAVAAGLPVDLRQVIRLRLAADVPAPDTVAALYRHAGAHLVLARLHLAMGDRGAATAQCVLAANLGDPAAVAELVRLHRQFGDHVTADMIERHGLTDDGGANTGRPR
ncbi:hypothetical protein [Dactylosporangium sp. NPDC048998]|uniref:hypothetical protein n=1 Tax=Dactylosporangium sp. NPDC048998 TaxID=3363976 RepID=UPI00370FAEDB